MGPERVALTSEDRRDYGTIRLDATGRIASWCGEAEVVTGFSGADAIGQHVRILYSPEDGESQVPEAHLHHAASEGLFHEEEWRPRKDGGRYWAEFLIYSVCETHGYQPGFALMIRDITPRKLADDQLRKLWRAVEQSPTSVVITDVNGAIEYVNPKFTVLTGYTLADALGQNPRILKSEVTPSSAYSDMWNTILSGEEWRGEFCNRKKNGELYWEFASISAVRNAEGQITHFVAVKEDITERKKVEEQIRVLNHDLEERANQLQALNEELAAFSFSVSHDLRAPLRRVDGFSQALLEDYADLLAGDGIDYLHRIRGSVGRMSQLIEDMLLLSQVTRSEMRHDRVDISAIAAEVAEDLRRSSPDRKVEVVIHPSMVADGDPRLLRIALENLIGNAWKFSSVRGDARIEVGHGNADAGEFYFVRDNGAGFDMKHAEKLFAPFQRLHSETEFPGTGIGLATVQRVIRRHGGRIWATGKVDCGATFFFSLWATTLPACWHG